MKKIYTCFVCGFPFAVDEAECPDRCPSCNATKDHFLSEPWNGSIEKRRIHVSPPVPDENRDPFDISYHHPKNFPPHSLHGRIRRFVLPYDDLAQTREFFGESMGWDMFDTEHSDPEKPLIYCATGPGNANWEPRFPSFGYGYLKARDSYETDAEPRFVVEVDNIEDTLEKVKANGGSVLKSRFTVEGNDYAIVTDAEGTPMYLWQTPADQDWTLPETKYLSRR